MLVDCVTSLGGIPVEIDDWGVDLAYGGTQKCLGVAPGLAPFTMNERATERRVPQPQSWYLDLDMLAEYAVRGAARKYHHTAPIAMILSLHAGLGALLDEGLEASWARHANAARLLQAGLEELGLELFAEEGHRLPELTTVLRACGHRRRRRPPPVARALRHRDRRRRGRVRRQGVAHRLHGPHGPAPQRDPAARRLGGGAGQMSWAVHRPSSLELVGRRVMLRPLVVADFEPWREVRKRSHDWLVKWEPKPIPGQPDVVEDRRVFAARCGARDRERQLGSGYGFGIFVGLGVRRRDQPVVDPAGAVPERLRRLLDRREAGRQQLRARGGRAGLPLRLRGAGPAPPADRHHPPQRPQPPGGREAPVCATRGRPQRYLEINGVWEDHVRYAITAEEWWDKREHYAEEWLTPLS